MQFSTEERKSIFLKISSSIIRNSHSSIKQVWVILFSGGTISFVNSFDAFLSCKYPEIFPSSVRCSNFLGNSELNNTLNVSSILMLYLVYILTFYRFFVGNIRVFDTRYIEVGDFVSILLDSKMPSPDSKKSSKDIDPSGINQAANDLHRKMLLYYDRNQRMESFILILNTMLIVGLTPALNDPILFFCIYTLILLSALIWTLFSTSSNHFKEIFSRSPSPPPFYKEGLFLQIFPELREKIEMLFPSTAMAAWFRNNITFGSIFIILCAFIFFLPIFRAPGSALIFVLALFALCNCLFDLYATWRFYNPVFSKAYDQIDDETINFRSDQV